MGYSPGTAPEPVTDLIEEVSAELMPLGDVKAEYIIFDRLASDPYNKSIEIEGVVFEVKPIIFSQIRKAGGCALHLHCRSGGWPPEPHKHEGW